VRLEILHVPQCPNVALLDQRLDDALAGHPGPVERSHRIVEDLQTAAAAGMTGSPTLLVDDTDPFGQLGVAPSVSCRLYRGDDGRIQGAPSVAALRRALGLAEPDRHDDEPAVTAGTEGCCVDGADASAAAALHSWRTRTAPADPAERALHQAILRAFAVTGAPPEHGELGRVAAAFDMAVEDVLGRLHTADVVRLDPAGQIRVAYPFSASPTRHRVRLTGGIEVSAMCAIDALGIPPMLGADATITTTDPVSSAPVTVVAVAGQFTWTPATAVVFVGARPGGGPSAETCCDYLNMFTDRHQADTWIQAHPHLPGEILAPAQAEQLGRKIFGDLLAGCGH